MTSSEPQTPEQAEEAPRPEQPPSYYISFERLADLKRSAVALVAERKSPARPKRPSLAAT